MATEIKHPLDGLNEDEQAQVIEYAQRAPGQLMDKLNWGLDCHPSNISSRTDVILRRDTELRLRWGRKFFDNILEKSN